VYEISGQMRNDEPVAIDNTSVVVTLYSGPDESGIVRRCRNVSPSAHTLAPGQSSAFKFTDDALNFGDVGSYRLQAQARRLESGVASDLPGRSQRPGR